MGGGGGAGICADDGKVAVTLSLMLTHSLTLAYPLVHLMEYTFQIQSIQISLFESVFFGSHEPSR